MNVDFSVLICHPPLQLSFPPQRPSIPPPAMSSRCVGVLRPWLLALRLLFIIRTSRILYNTSHCSISRPSRRCSINCCICSFRVRLIAARRSASVSSANQGTLAAAPPLPRRAKGPCHRRLPRRHRHRRHLDLRRHHRRLPERTQPRPARPENRGGNW